MPTLVAGTSTTIILTENNSLSVSSNNGFASLSVVGVAGPIYSDSWGPSQYRRVLGPFKEGATVVLRSQTADVTYDGLHLPDVATLQSLVSSSITELSGVTYDGSNRCIGFTLNDVSYTITGWGSTTVVVTGSDGSIRTITFDGSGRISGVS